MKNYKILLIAAIAAIASGCSTTNSIPYKVSTSNVIAIQQALESQAKEVSVGNVSMKEGVEESPTCRLMGPIKVAPGKTPADYIKDAFIEELFMAQAYSPTSQSQISAQIDEINFSSVSPASWDIAMTVNSSNSTSYSVSVNYNFDTSWDAYSACKNVADAFGPAVQALLGEVVTHPDFPLLAI